MFGGVFDAEFVRQLGERIARGIGNEDGCELKGVETGIRQTQSTALEKLHVEPNGVSDDRVFADETSERWNERMKRGRTLDVGAGDARETLDLGGNGASGIDKTRPGI